jgi:hypothetical protein
LRDRLAQLDFGTYLGVIKIEMIEANPFDYYYIACYPDVFLCGPEKEKARCPLRERYREAGL